jgi:hypothetical protein
MQPSENQSPEKSYFAYVVVHVNSGYAIGFKIAENPPALSPLPWIETIILGIYSDYGEAVETLDKAKRSWSPLEYVQQHGGAAVLEAETILRKSAWEKEDLELAARTMQQLKEAWEILEAKYQEAWREMEERFAKENAHLIRHRARVASMMDDLEDEIRQQGVAIYRQTGERALAAGVTINHRQVVVIASQGELQSHFEWFAKHMPIVIMIDIKGLIHQLQTPEFKAEGSIPEEIEELYQRDVPYVTIASSLKRK